MSTQTFNPRTIVILVFMLAVASLRVILNTKTGFSLLTNFTPIGAMALFGGAYFNKPWKAYLFPLLTLWLSDIILSRFVYQHQWQLFYHGAYWIYGAFVLMVIAGKYVLRNVTVKNILLSAFAITFIHWVIADLGVWSAGSLYPKTISGWWACMAAAIPFERNFLCGTLLYAAVMFGSFAWMKTKYPSLVIA
ncbi:MAG: hypothetical protein M3139_09985 [Bacteroidota bacterium]|nr:hypothetical protein [Bacteroidota bacterium]